jgi:hypothetical protein
MDSATFRRVARLLHCVDSHFSEESAMHWIKVSNPEYDQSKRYAGQVGEVVGRWGPENSADSREGYLVQFADGEVVGITDKEAEVVEDPAEPRIASQAHPA